jgi:hypothetical protein
MAGRTAIPQGRKLNNINNIPDRRYLPSINFSVPFARLNSLLIGLNSCIEHIFRQISPFLCSRNLIKISNENRAVVIDPRTEEFLIFPNLKRVGKNNGIFV